MKIKLKSKILILILALTSSTVGVAEELPDTRAGNKCSDVLGTKSIALEQVNNSKNLSQLLRSNSRHYWSVAKKTGKKYFLKSVLQQGIVVGDGHNGNFGPIYLGDEIIWAPNDLDDAGTAPFIYDIAQFAIKAKAISSELKFQKIWDAYIAGLNGEKYTPIRALSQYFNISTEEYRRASEKYVDKKLDNDGHFEIEVGELERLPRQVFGISVAGVKKKIKSYFSDYTVLDYAVRPKDRGGSKDSLRIWVLVENSSGEKLIFEIKEVASAGIDVIEIQKPNLQRLKEALTHFWGSSYTALHGFISLNNHLMFVRPKKVDFFDVPYNPKDAVELDFLKALTYWNAYVMGQTHGIQKTANAYKTELSGANKATHFAAYKAFSKAYFGSVTTAFETAEEE